ncbi:GxxExxY protein [Rhodohalobacter sp. SW132]|uniref:GxxExxY protein n=1 Tax=Rhodohalobacter sp. SW132 TaxID=2293433 RepID=UPI000E232277|nr:GxxExxY protein [Rhodohalobacter sp. SW132]REL33196.1 GxxExxY protein [Rhodohalobacter sp. SW132]
MIENELSKHVLDICFNIHRGLGPGLFESVYEEVLCHELECSGFEYQRQNPIPVYWKDKKMGVGFVADVIIENKLIIELKSVQLLAPVHYKQLLTYLKLTNLKLGLLINFNEELLKTGIKRIVNRL